MRHALEAIANAEIPGVSGGPHAASEEVAAFARQALAEPQLPSRAPAEWVLELICCGHDEGINGFRTGETADCFREAYLRAEGHERVAIKRRARPGEVVGWQERSSRS